MTILIATTDTWNGCAVAGTKVKMIAETLAVVKVSDRRVQLIKCHAYNPITWFCACGLQLDLNAWAEHVDRLITDFHNTLPVQTRKHTHDRLCYLNECKYPGDFPDDSFRRWSTPARAYALELQFGSAS